VLNLQNQDELKLSNAVKLSTIEARSREEAKCASKVYATTLEDCDREEAQIDTFQQGTSYNRQAPNWPFTFDSEVIHFLQVSISFLLLQQIWLERIKTFGDFWEYIWIA
jgi:hypothetical protein